MYVATENKRESPVIDFIVVLAFVFALGFPGNYRILVGESVAKMLEYVTNILEISAMLLSSGENILDIKPVNLKSRHRICYFLLAVFFIDSMLVTSIPKEQAISCIRFTTSAFFGLWLAERYKLHELLELLYRAQVIFLILTLGLFVMRPDLCFNRQNNNELSFVGMFDVKNSCALELCYALIGQVLLLWYKRKNNISVSILFLLVIVVEIVLMLMCRATGALFCGLVPFVYLLFWRMRPHRLPIGFLYTVLSIGFITFGVSILSLIAPFLESIGKDATLTGRTTLWAQYINTMLESHTLTGYGFNSFWRDEFALGLFHAKFQKDSWFHTMTYGAHNMILELWGDVGLIGVGTYFATILVAFKNSKHMPDFPYLFCTMYMTLFMIKGFTERAYTTSNFQTVFIFVLMGVALMYPEISADEIREQVPARGGHYGRSYS